MDVRSRVRVGAGVAAVGIIATVGTVAADPASAAVPSTTTTSASASAAAARPGCGLGAWTGRVEGVPTGFAAGARGGDYLWHTPAGFRLRITHGGDHRAVYTGQITANTPMTLGRVHLEPGDVARLSANRKTIVFAFADHGRVDGLDFTTACATAVRVSHLNVGNQLLPANRVYLGAHRTHPTRVPFTLTRPHRTTT